MDTLTSNEETSTTVTLSKVCRTCLCEGRMCNISEIYIGGKELSEVLSLYASVQIEPNDNLPQRMCLNCIDELMRIDLFVTKCKASDKTLRDVISEVKTEPEGLCDIRPEIVVFEQLDTLRDIKTESGDRCDVGPELVACESSNTLRDVKTELEEGRYVGLEVEQLNTSVPSRNYICSFCATKFGSSAELTSHRHKTKHFKEHRCEFCEKTYTTNSALMKHKMEHMNEKPYVCETCGKGNSCESVISVKQFLMLMHQV